MANLPLAHTAGRPTVPSTFFRQLLNDESACASYLFGCKTHSKLAVVDPHIDLVDDYIAMAQAQGAPIVAIFETHVQADHVSGLPDLAQRTDAVADLLVYPAHYSGSVCGRGLSAHPASTIGFERRHNAALQLGSEDAFVEALVRDVPPAPSGQVEIVAANRSGTPRARAR